MLRGIYWASTTGFHCGCYAVQLPSHFYLRQTCLIYSGKHRILFIPLITIMGNTFISGSCWWTNPGTRRKNQQCSESHCLQIFIRTYQDITGKLVPQQLFGGKIDYVCFWNMRPFVSYWKAFEILHSITHSNCPYLCFCLPVSLLHVFLKIILWCFICDIWSNDLEYLLTPAYSLC